MSHNANTVFITPGNPPIGITTGDIAAVLGRSDADIGQLCADSMGLIRMWAKKKPVRYNKWGIIDDTERKSVNQGLDTTVATATGNPTNSSSFFYNLLHGTLSWTYLRPRGLNPGGSSNHEQFRYRDFNGYDNRAVYPPAYPFSLTSVMLGYDEVNLNNGKLQINFDKRSREDYELSLGDLRMDGTDINNWYFGVLLFYPTNNTYTYAAQTTVGSGELSVIFRNMTSWAGRTVQVVPFLSKTQISQTSSGSTNARVISFLGFEPVNVEIVASSSNVFVEFNSVEWNEANTAVSYNITIRNRNSVAKNGLTLYVALWEGDADSQSGSVDQRTVPNVNISANGYYTLTGSFTGLVRTPNEQYFIAINSVNDNVIPRQVDAVEDYIPNL